ncbi:uncharacterized protein LOC134173060 [Pezoporus occidentalis]|uniref:uncharacterized protein LOC134173060 n=1 Tax=Pezoporus occidentalis TaxID=407982 RepID=UPI002F91838C
MAARAARRKAGEGRALPPSGVAPHGEPRGRCAPLRWVDSVGLDTLDLLEPYGDPPSTHPAPAPRPPTEEAPPRHNGGLCPTAAPRARKGPPTSKPHSSRPAPQPHTSRAPQAQALPHISPWGLKGSHAPRAPEAPHSPLWGEEWPPIAGTHKCPRDPSLPHISPQEHPQASILLQPHIYGAAAPGGGGGGEGPPAIDRPIFML